MNGQLNGFHDAFIEEGTFLFTSESVGEGHPGEVTGPGAKRGAGRGVGTGRQNPPAAVPKPVALSRLLVERAAAARLPRGAAAAERVAAAPPSSLLPSHPAARPGMRKIPENEKGGGRGRSCSSRGGHYFLLPALRSEPPRVGGPPRVLASGPRERAPRIAASTTCLPHVASGRGSRLVCRAWPGPPCLRSSR